MTTLRHNFDRGSVSPAGARIVPIEAEKLLWRSDCHRCPWSRVTSGREAGIRAYRAHEREEHAE